MKVLFPQDLFYPSKVGGPANTLYWLCKALARKGHEIFVVATKEGIDGGKVIWDEWIDVDGINTIYCSSTSKISFDIIRHSIKKIKKVDTVVLSSACYIPNIIIAIIAKLKRKKIIWSPRGELFDSAVNGSIGKKSYFAVLRLLFGRKALFHATSEAEKETVIKYFPHSSVVIIPNYMEVPDKEDVKSDYSDFLYVGRIAPIKALEKLIEGLSLSKLFRKMPCHMILVGGVEKQFEDYYKELINQINNLSLQDKVIFKGSLTGKDKYKAYAAARYSFLVSNSENFGNVVIEALSQGTPVVTSKGTPWAQLPELKAGFWIDNTPGEIAKTVDFILEQTNDNYIQYRENAFNFSKAFDINEHIVEWEKVL